MAMTKKNQPKDKIAYEITPDGSLGLFASGAKGLRAWRKVRDKKKAKSSK